MVFKTIADPRLVPAYSVAAAGYPVLAKAAKATVQRILDAQTLRPHKVTYYYLERSDPNFLSKMKDVLVVYQEVALQNEAVLNGLKRGFPASGDHGLGG